MHMKSEKIKSIKNAPRPTNASEVRSHLGTAQYVSRFIANFATIVAPLRELTRQDEPWHWEQLQEQSFQALTKDLANTSTMTYFDPNTLSEVFACAIPLGLGAILTQGVLSLTLKADTLKRNAKCSQLSGAQSISISICMEQAVSFTQIINLCLAYSRANV